MNDMQLPPHDRAAEAALIGCVFRYNGTFSDLGDTVQPGDFYVFAHQVVWTGLRELIGAGKPADPVTLYEWLSANGKGGDVSPRDVSSLWEGAPSAGHVAGYAEIVKSKAVYRALIHAGMETTRDGYDQAGPPEELIEAAESRIYDIAQRQYTGEVVDMPTAVGEAMDALDRRSGKSPDGEVEEALPYGWHDLDRLTGGMHNSELIVVGARPSIGKTVFGMNILRNALKHGRTCYFASIEQGRTELIHRWLAQIARVNSWKFRQAKFIKDEEDAILAAATELRANRLFIDDSPSQGIMRILTNARRIKTRGTLDAVVLDYLQLVQPASTHGNRTEQVGAISRGLKQMARELKVPVVALAQLNRQKEQRGADSEPRLADLRESGSIEQDADCVVLLHKPEPPDPERPVDVLQVEIAKQRNGPLGKVVLAHEKRFFKISNLELRQQAG